MKKLLLFLFVFITSQIDAQMDVYHPIPDTAIFWRENISDFNCEGCCCSASTFEETYQLYLNGDTLIEPYIYKKIYKTGFVIDHFFGVNWNGNGGNGDCPDGCEINQPRYYSNAYVGALRQDVINRKVYIFPTNSYITTDTLLYDFNLSIGDTLPLTFNSYGDFIVSGIDSIIIGNQYHKKFLLTGGGVVNEKSLIEGVGSTFGLINGIGYPISGSYSLDCIQVESQWTTINYYAADSAYYCQLISGLEKEKVKYNFQVSVFPNPFHLSTGLNIDLSFGKCQLKIFNLLGKLVKEESFLPAKTIIIERGNLINGIYFFQIENQGGKQLKGKFVIV